MSLYAGLVAILSADSQVKRFSLILIGGMQVSILRADFEVAEKAPLITFCALYCRVSSVASWDLLCRGSPHGVYQIDSPYVIWETTTAM